MAGADPSAETVAAQVVGEGWTWTRAATAGAHVAEGATWAGTLSGAVPDRLSRVETRSLGPVQARRGGGSSLSRHGWVVWSSSAR